MNEEDVKRIVSQLTEALTQRLDDFEKKYAEHQHDNLDGTNILRKKIELDADQSLTVGRATQQSAPITGAGSASEQIIHAFAVGKDDGQSGFVNKSGNMQVNYIHQPNATTSFITALRKPLVTSVQGASIATTLGGNTVTIAGYAFATDELAGGLINIFNSSGTFIESQTIASNTATVVTISGTWLASTSNATFFIYIPVFFGSADTIYQRLYTQEGTAGGIRFGVGPTAGGQNGLLYMDATGDIYWRNKGGTSTKLN